MILSGFWLVLIAVVPSACPVATFSFGPGPLTGCLNKESKHSILGQKNTNFNPAYRHPSFQSLVMKSGQPLPHHPRFNHHHAIGEYSTTAIRSYGHSSSIPGMEGRKTKASFCRGRGSKSKLYFAQGWTIHSGDHGWEAPPPRICSPPKKAKQAGVIRYKARMVLGGFAVMLFSFPAVALLVKPVVGLNLVTKMFANAVAGMTAIAVMHPMGSIFAEKDMTMKHAFAGLRDALASQIVLRSMSILSFTYIHHLISRFSFASTCFGLPAVGVAALATGVVMGLVSAPLLAADDIDSHERLPQKLKRLAGRGAFTEKGLFGRLSDSMVENVVGFGVFFVAYEMLALQWPGLVHCWMGTAGLGGLAGTASAIAVFVIDGLRNLDSVQQDIRDWLRGKKCIRSDVQDVVGECSSAAGFNSVLFVSYKAVLLSLLPA